MKRFNVVIVGSGPAGYTSAIYASRSNMDVMLFEGFFSGVAGGQLMTTTEIENFPGFPEGIAGPELMMNFRQQAVRFGTEFVTEDVLSIDTTQRPFIVKGSRTVVQADAIIIATGAKASRLDVPGARDGELWQKGVTACAVCDGAMPIFRDKELYVIGGGDTACEEAVFLTKYASKVYLVHRRDELRASKIMAERVIKHPKIEVLWNKVLETIEGDKIVERVVLRDAKNGILEERPAAGVFFAIGHVPNVGFLEGKLRLEDNGYIAVRKGSCETSVPGVFAAGDVQDHKYRQAITAAGSGCMAALEAENWLISEGLI